MGVEVGAQYLEQLSETDLSLLVGAASAAVTPEAAPGWFRAHPDEVEVALRSPVTFDRVLGPSVADEPLAHASPFLVFAVAVHRTADELPGRAFVEERVGPHRRIPVFDATDLAEFSSDPEHRLFVSEHLASYTRVASGPVWVRRGNRWRRYRFSEMDPQRLAEMLGVLGEEDRPGIYRRLGDLALFLTGVFPDHTRSRTPHPVELERLLRSVADEPDCRLRPDDLERVLGDRGSAGLLEWLGPRWYRLAASTTPIPPVSRLLSEIADGFDLARRFLNQVTERYLFPLRSRWWPAPGA